MTALEDATLVELSFHLTFQELQDILHTAVRKNAAAFPQRRMIKKWMRMVLCAAVLIVAIAAWQTWDHATTPDAPVTSGANMLFSMAIFAMVIAWVLWRMLNGPRRQQTTAADSAAHAQHALALQPGRLTASAAGVSAFGESKDELLRWSGIASVTDLGTYVSIDHIDGRFFPVPSRLFADDAARRTFVTTLQRWLAQAPGTDIRRIHAHMRTTDTPCAQCRFNLRGGPAVACPKCGLGLNRFTVPAAFKSAASS